MEGKTRVQVSMYPGEVAYSDMVRTHACSAEAIYFVEFEDGYSGYFSVNDVQPHDPRQYKFNHKGQDYLIKVRPDIAVRGGWNGKGCTTSIWRLDDEGRAIPGVRGYQGRHSKAGILRVIKNWELA